MEELIRLRIPKAASAKVNRCRKRQEVMWISGIANASGGSIERQYYSDWRDSHEGSLANHRSTIPFGREYPTENDWKEWRKALNMITLDGPQLLKSLGRWGGPSLRIWRYWHNDETGEIKAIGERETTTFLLDQSSRGQSKHFQLAHTHANVERGQARGDVEAASVTFTADNRATLTCSARKNERIKHAPGLDIIGRLESWGGTWMWKKLDFKEDLRWVSEALESGTLVCVTDGSFNRKRAHNICGAGWVIHCTRTGKQIKGAFVEHSTSASSYRGELLGMLEINLFLLAVEESHRSTTGSSEVHCDNKGALYTFEKEGKWVPLGAKNADIQRVLRRVKGRMTGKHSTHHVKAHQDDHRQR